MYKIGIAWMLFPMSDFRKSFLTIREQLAQSKLKDVLHYSVQMQ